MEIIFEGHACFRILHENIELMIDPFISGNSLTNKKPADFAPDLMLITHGHGDHLGDAVEIMGSCGGTLAAQVDLLNAINTDGIETIAFNLGGSINFHGLRITMTPAWHGNSIKTPRGSIYAGIACGYIISDGQKTIYHAGDTALFGDMATVISRYAPDVALLPIGDHYTMGPADAVTAVQWLGAKTVIPMHYNTFPIIRQDAQKFRAMVEEQTTSKCIILEPSESFIL